jgi:hypothetical protein
MQDGGMRPASKLALRGKSKTELEVLASRFLSAEEARDLDKGRLVEALSLAADENQELAQELANSEIAVKPSFHLTLLDPLGEQVPARNGAFEELRSVLDDLNANLNMGQDLPPHTGFRVEEVTEVESILFEVRFTWRRIHWYWHPDDFSRRHIYEARFGFALLDFRGRKAIISCHDRKERDHLAKALSRVFSVRLAPMVLTQPILDQIGSFDNVKRASYFIGEPPADVPSNITYADENLASSIVAREEELNFRSQRRQSFYRIPLGELVETGVGVTSDPGKIWIPREVPLSTAREYGLRLLSKVSDTLGELVRRQQTDDVLDIVGISQLPAMKAIRPVELREEVVGLFAQLVNMLVNGETERPFTPSPTLVVEGTRGDVAGLFLHPRLEIPDTEGQGGIAFWRDSDGRSQQVRVSLENGALVFTGERSGEQLDLGSLPHPVTGEPVDVSEPLTHLELVPKPRLQSVLMEAIRRVSGQMEKLSPVRFLPFHVSAGRLRLDVDRALGRRTGGEPHPVVRPEELRELGAALSRDEPSRGERERLDGRLVQLGEQCEHMNDTNCRSCVAASAFLCLRSLVARRFSNHLLLAHKGIELSDVQFEATIDGEPARVFGFAKMSGTQKGLTSRNGPGAILTAQVLSQVRRTDFKVVAVITASTVNEDIREQLRDVCSVFGKRLLILDSPALRKLLIEFEDEATFTPDMDPEEIYEASGI